MEDRPKIYKLTDHNKKVIKAWQKYFRQLNRYRQYRFK